MFRGICGVCGKELEEDYSCSNRNQHGKEKKVKKYRLKNPDMKGVVTGHMWSGKIVILGDEDSTDVELNNQYIYKLSSDIRVIRSLSSIYAHILGCPPCFYNNETILERVGDGWPIELGLVEEIPEEPKRVHMDRYEALRMVYEYGKKVAYDSERWLDSYEFIFYKHTVIDTLTGNIRCGLSKRYDQNLWYVVEED